jgi:RNA polymerase sigma factor (sigma-70 family)
MRELTDGQLLERFATARGETAELAFAVLVERHGPMVLRVCRSVLLDSHDAQDAFQATFLVLVKKARALWVRDSLGPWLHEVSYRTATCARAAAARRRRHERRASLLTTECRVEVGDELRRVLHEEIHRLPERFRAPIVLCDLGGRTHDQAARHLGWPVGTVKSRLWRGRERLREQIRRRGLAPECSLFCLDADPAVISPALVNSTARVAVHSLSAGTIVKGTAAAILAWEVLRSMTMTRWLGIGSVAVALGVGAPGVHLLAQKETSKVEAQAGADPSPKRADKSVLVVKPGKLTVTFVARGVVEASRAPFVTSPVVGRTSIVSILPEGTMVKKGDLVCELDSAALRVELVKQDIVAKGAEATYQNAKLTREVAEVAVVEYEKGIFQQGLETVQGEIALAQANLKRAEDRVDWADKMEKKGFLSRDQLTSERLSLQKAKFALEQAQTKKNVLEKYTHGKTVKELKSEIEKARAEELTKELTWQLEKSKKGILLEQIASCKLYAPGDGPIVYANDSGRIGLRQIERGATVRERQIIFFVPDLSGPMQVDIKLPESHVRQITPGLWARIRIDALVRETFPGVVDSVATIPDSQRAFNKSELTVYTSKVKIETVVPGLLPGMSAVVEILVTQLANVLSVPVSAVLDRDGRAHLLVKKADGQVEWREVTLGVSNGKVVEVKQGLGSGDGVVTDPTALESEKERLEQLDPPDGPSDEPSISR